MKGDWLDLNSVFTSHCVQTTNNMNPEDFIRFSFRGFGMCLSVVYLGYVIPSVTEKPEDSVGKWRFNTWLSVRLSSKIFSHRGLSLIFLFFFFFFSVKYVAFSVVFLLLNAV